MWWPMLRPHTKCLTPVLWPMLCPHTKCLTPVIWPILRPHTKCLTPVLWPMLCPHAKCLTPVLWPMLCPHTKCLTPVLSGPPVTIRPNALCAGGYGVLFCTIFIWQRARRLLCSSDAVVCAVIYTWCIFLLSMAGKHETRKRVWWHDGLRYFHWLTIYGMR